MDIILLLLGVGAYFIIIQILYTGYRSMPPSVDGTWIERVKIGFVRTMTSHKSEGDSDVEYSMMYHTSKWFKRFGYDSDINYSSKEDKEFEINGEKMPGWVKGLSLILSLFRVIFFPFTFKEEGL